MARRQYPHHQTGVSYRLRILLVIFLLISLVVFVHEQESRFRRGKGSASSASSAQKGDKGVRNVLAGADRIIGKSYRYISDHVKHRVKDSTNDVGGDSFKASHLRDEEMAESALFEQLIIEEETGSEEHGVALPGDTHSAKQVMQMMEEGVVEDPVVDHDDIEDNGTDTKAESEATAIVEGIQISPSREELESGDAIVMSVSKTNNEELLQEEGDDPEEADVHIKEEPNLDEEAASSEAVPQVQSLFLPGPFVKGGLSFKMVNTHFLANIDAFRDAGWKWHSYNSLNANINLFLTKPVTIVPGSSGKMISQISHSSCLGGTKGTQLSCRSKFAAEHGCSFDDLKISPRQFNMWRAADCERFFEVALHPKNKEKQWIGKLGASYHGKHITIYKGVTKSIKVHFGKCKMNKDTGGGYIMMEYVSNPALVGNRKFDLRTFLLIASTKPYLVFYHRGFIRRSSNQYSTSNVNDKLAHITNLAGQDSDDHFWGFDDLERALHVEHGFPEDYMRNVFEPRAKKITNYVFQASRARLKRKQGAFALFALDWMIDADQGMHLLEGNGNPTIQHYPGTGDLTPKVWRDMASLVTRVHMEIKQKEPLGPLEAGFRHGGWELVFSELEEVLFGQPYNPCNAGL